MKKIILFPCLLLMAFLCNAQSSPSCPSLTVSCSDKATIGEATYFTANVSGGDAQVTPTFNWTISNGSITSGQGTSSITVGTTGLQGTITATVDIGGYSRECYASNSCTVMLEAGAKKQTSSTTFTPAAMDFIVKKYLVMAGLDNPQPLSFVYLYPGKNWKAAQTTKMQTALTKAFEKNKVPKENYRIVTGVPKAKASYVFYIVPAGAAEPTEE